MSANASSVRTAKHLQFKGSKLYAFFALVCALVTTLALSACTNSSPSEPADFSNFPVADISGFESLEGQDADGIFVEVDVLDVAAMIEAKKSFVLFCAFPGCPWCESMLPVLVDVAKETGTQIALINTRKNPAWTSNFDIDNYDKFAEMFGEWLEVDENNRPHLYVPDLYFVKNGEVVAHHQGVIAGYDDPRLALTDEQSGELSELLSNYFTMIA